METRGAAMSFTAAAAGGFVVFLLCMPAVQGNLPIVTVSPSGEIVEGSSVTLTCRRDAPPPSVFTWYKMKTATLSDHDAFYIGRGPEITFKSIQYSEFGVFYCKAERAGSRLKPKSNFVFLDIRYPPKTTTASVSSSGEIVEHSSVTLTCNSDANPKASYTWYKMNEEKPVPASKGADFVIRSIQSVHNGEYICEGANHLGKRKSTTSIIIDVKYAPKLFSLSVSPSVIVEGSSVTLTCSNDANPAPSYTWYKKNGKKPLSKGPQFVISSIQFSDSGEFFCEAENLMGKKKSKFISVDVNYPPRPPSVSVSPSGEIVEGRSVTLTCSSDANPAASYTWYKKNETKPLSEGPKLVFKSIKSSDSGEYVCEAKNLLGTERSTSISIDVKYAPRLPSVSVSPSGEIVEGSSVTLTCSSDANPAASYTWYKKNDKKPLSKGPQFVFSSIQSSESGQYDCEAENHLGTKRSKLISVDVKHPPRLPSVSVSPSGEIVEERSVTLTCSSNANPAASYTWYKKNEKKTLSEGSKLNFRSIQSSNSGEYDCEAKNHLGTERSKFNSIDVKYAPRPPSVSVSPSGEIVEGSSVNLNCSSDANPAASYTWYKKNDKKPLSKGPQLVFSSIQSSDSRQYDCEVKNHLGTKRSKFISIDVKYPPKPPSVSVSPSGEIVEGSSVTLTCSSDANPAANYTWYKKNETKPLSEGPKLVFRSIQSSVSAEYVCEAENHLGRRKSTTSISIDVKYAPRPPSVSVSPSVIVEGSSVNLTCSSDANPAASYTWYKKDDKKHLSKGPQLVFSSIQSSESEEYVCEVKNHVGKKRSEFISLDVKYPPRPPSVSVSPSGDIVEGRPVTLTCSSDANPPASYTWYKKNETKPLSEGPQFVFRSIQSSVSGEYDCEAENHLGRRKSTTSTSIDVKYAPRLLSVSMSPSGEIVEGNSVNLTCSSDANPPASYTWYKKNDKKPLSEGPQLVFSSIQFSDFGHFYCEVKNQLRTRKSKFIFVDVKYAPRRPSVSVSPSEILEGSSVTLTCSSNANPPANYTWYKKDEDSLKESGQIFIIDDFRDENSGNYYCEAQNTRGRSNSSFYYVTVSGPLTIAVRWTIFGSAIAVFLALMILDACLFIRRKRSSDKTSQPAEGPDNTQQEDLGYASVNLSGNQTPNEEDEEDDQTTSEEDEEDGEDEEDEEDDQTPNEEDVGGLCQIL